MQPSEAADTVLSVLAAGTGQTDLLDGAAAILATLADRSQLLEIIRAIRNDSAMVMQCATASVRHPLGHDKIMLIGTYPSFFLRLHAWWPDRERDVEHVHHHRYGLATTMLRGHYEMQLFRPSASGTAMIEYRQHSSADAREWYLDSTGATKLRLLTTTNISEGAGYTLTADALHRVLVPPGTLCLTLFLAVIGDSGMPLHTRVFAAPDSVAPSLTRAHVLTADEYRQRLDTIAMELGSTD